MSMVTQVVSRSRAFTFLFSSCQPILSLTPLLSDVVPSFTFLRPKPATDFSDSS